MIRVHACMVPVSQQLSQIPILPAGHPDLPKRSSSSTRRISCVLAIRLLLAYLRRADRGRISNPQLKLQLGHESLRFSPNGTGVGIRGMRKRVRHFRGDLLIESNRSGTKAYATLPLTTLSMHKSNQPSKCSAKPNPITSGQS